MSLTIIERQGELVVDSRLVAEALGIQHKNFLATIDKYRQDTESEGFTPIAFEVRKVKLPQGGSYKERWAWLTETQLKTLIARSRNGISKEAIASLASQGWNLSVFKERPRKRKRPKESDYRKALAKKLGGKQEVYTFAGNIDVLTATELIEVKSVIAWKSALGQVLVYGCDYPSHQKRIHLFGETQKSFLSMIRYHCDKYDVTVTWEA